MTDLDCVLPDLEPALAERMMAAHRELVAENPAQFDGMLLMHLAIARAKEAE